MTDPDKPPAASTGQKAWRRAEEVARDAEGYWGYRTRNCGVRRMNRAPDGRTISTATMWHPWAMLPLTVRLLMWHVAWPVPRAKIRCIGKYCEK
jgi:hypothetical protein